MIPSTFRRLPRALLLALLVGAPAGAIIAPAADTEKEAAAFRDLYQRIGEKHPSVVRIQAFLAEADGRRSKRTGSGVFLGIDKHGVGSVLTAAHNFAVEAGQDLKGENLHFGPKVAQPFQSSSDDLPVKVMAVGLHPKWAFSGSVQIHDLAIAYFDGSADGVAKTLESRGIYPAVLWENEEKDPLEPETLLEGIIAGFGRYGTADNPIPDRENDHVTGGLADFGVNVGEGGRQFYTAWLLEEGGNGRDEEKETKDQPLAREKLRCKLADAGDRVCLWQDQEIALTTRPGNVLTNVGDSGGGLFFAAKGKGRLAGIIARIRILPMTSKKTKKETRVCLEEYESVLEHRAWIDAALRQEEDGGLRWVSPDAGTAPLVEHGLTAEECLDGTMELLPVKVAELIQALADASPSSDCKAL